MEKLKVILSIVKLLYKNVLRAELQKLVAKTDSQVDDYIIDILDRLLISDEK